jgi:hypothetical protein
VSGGGADCVDICSRRIGALRGSISDDVFLHNSGPEDSVVTSEYFPSWDRRRLACITRFSRFALSAGETPAVPGRAFAN